MVQLRCTLPVRINGHLSVASLLLKLEIDPDCASIPMNDGSTPLYVTCQEGHESLVSLLIQQDPTRCSTHWQQERCNSTLYVACQEGHLSVASLIVDCDPSTLRITEQNGATPLYVLHARWATCLSISPYC